MRYAAEPFRISLHLWALTSCGILAALLLWPATCAGGGALHAFPPRVGERPLAVARPEIVSSKHMITVSESSVEYRIEQDLL